MTILLPQPLYRGNAVTAGVTFSNPVPGQLPPSWPLIDPNTVSLTVTDGDGNVTTYAYGAGNTIIRTSQGIYQAEIDTSPASGRWKVKWVGTGACAALWTRNFIVSPVPS